ncbi:MAG: hypothetical protein Q7S00_06235, partial [bacterium]|nr:hypothetical protein [bacterium]
TPASSADGEEVDDSYDDIRHKNYGTFLRGGRMDIASRRDLGGRKDLGDRCLGVNPIPLKLQLQHLTLNLEIQLTEEERRTQVAIHAIPGNDLVSFRGKNDQPVLFDCERLSLLTADEDGRRRPVNRDQCLAMRNSESRADNVGLQPSCTNQKGWQQLKSVLEGMLTCNLPNRLNQSFDAFRKNRLQQVSFKLLGKKIDVDLFSDLMQGEFRLIPPGAPVSTWGGIGVRAPALVLPAGIYNEDEERTTRARSFLTPLGARLQEQGVRLEEVGFLSQPAVAGASSIDFLRRLDKEIGLNLSEEGINMALEGVNLLLVDLEEEDPLFLDINSDRIRNDFELPVFAYDEVSEEGGGTHFVKVCRDLDGVTVADDECFPIPLNVQELFQQTFRDVDFNGSGQIEANGRDGITPLMFHLSLNPNLGITTR